MHKLTFEFEMTLLRESFVETNVSVYQDSNFDLQLGDLFMRSMEFVDVWFMCKRKAKMSRILIHKFTTPICYYILNGTKLVNPKIEKGLNGMPRQTLQSRLCDNEVTKGIKDYRSSP